MRLAAFLAACAIAVLVSALSLYAFLNLSKFRADVARLQAARFKIVADQVNDAVEKGLSLGLDLEDMDNIPLLLERLRFRHSELTGLAVLDGRGQVVFGGAGLPVPAGALPPLADRKGPAEMNGQRVLVTPILNSFAAKAGMVAVMYPANLAAPIVARTERAQLEATVTILIITGITCVLGTVLIVRRVLRPFVPLEAALQGIADGAPAPRGGAEGPGALEPGLRALVAGVDGHARDIRRETKALAQRLEEAA